ncbi:MAG: hypothetical protein ACRERD_31225, partial [Candidatus Binatia bacterium]
MVVILAGTSVVDSSFSAFAQQSRTASPFLPAELGVNDAYGRLIKRALLIGVDRRAKEDVGSPRQRMRSSEQPIMN